MIQLCLLLTVGIVSGEHREFVPLFRNSKSLTDVFPFSLQETDQPHEHQGHHDEDEDVSRESRQGSESNSEQSVAFSAVAQSYAGSKRCIDKVLMEEVTEWDEQYTCEHSYNRRCAKSLSTTYTAAQEEQCDENYVKNCFIEYGKTAQNVTARLCRRPLVKDCDGVTGEEICSTQYESECLTEQEKHEVVDDVPECKTVVDEKCDEVNSGYTSSQKCSKWPREECSLTKKKSVKYTPITKCNKVPVELCGPTGCGFVEGPELCYDRTQTVVSDSPEESCTLDPQRTCKFVTKLVPSLREVENCFDVPKEVCVRSQVNPRKVARPIVKKWCYVAQCPDTCVEAAKEGKCLPECEEFRDQSKCCAPCSLKCQEAARSDQCPRECEQYRGKDPSCCGGCPPECKDAARKCRDAVEKGDLRGLDACNNTPAGCRKYPGDDCNYSDPCPATCRRDGTQDICLRYRNIQGCYIEPVLACEDLPQCREAAKRGECLNECYEEYGEQAGCCPTCPNICKDFAKEQERTYTNTTIDLDCRDFDDKSCYFECPLNCRKSVNEGKTNEDCEKYTYLKDCYKPPPCSSKCIRAAKDKQCPADCKIYEGDDECCYQCPVKCRNDVNNGITNPDCKQYAYLGPQCYKPCPARCEAAFQQKKTDPFCKDYQDQPNCYYTPCNSVCLTAAAKGTCPASCEQYRGDDTCCSGCPEECQRAFKNRIPLAKCKAYETKYSKCYFKPITGCPPECIEKSRWGECPAQCKAYEGNPDCCAPTCPAKCTNKRRGECSASGVSECNGIPGCCPEKFDVVFGAGVYLENGEGDDK